MPHLPLELILAVVLLSSDDQPTLAALAATCQAVHMDCQRMLYRDIRIQGPNSMSRNLSFFATVVAPSSTHLASFVKSYRLYLRRSPNEIFTKAVIKGLQHLENLEHLECTAEDGNMALPQHCFGGGLKSLHWTCRGILGSSIVGFLCTQPYLQRVSLDHSLTLYNLSTFDLLTTLCGHRATIVSVLPCAPKVVNLTWYPDPGLDHVPLPIDSIPALEDGFRKLRFLDITPFRGHPDLENLTEYLTGLKSLHLRGWMENYEQVIIKLPDLEHLRISRLNLACHLRLTSAKSLAQRLFAACRSLGRVDVQNPTPKPEPLDLELYQRWERHISRPLRVKVKQDKEREYLYDAVHLNR